MKFLTSWGVNPGISLTSTNSGSMPIAKTDFLKLETETFTLSPSGCKTWRAVYGFVFALQAAP